MRLWKFGRASLLALFVSAGIQTAALAHALPGSLLTFSQDGDTIRLEIELALDDLIVAAPQFDVLEDAPNGALDGTTIGALNDYFSTHLSVHNASNTALPFEIEDGQLSIKEDHHSGIFQLLTVQFGAQSASDLDVLPLTLVYDGIMHEVRNHRATVLWQRPDGDTVWLSEFGFGQVDGKPRSFILDLE